MFIRYFLNGTTLVHLPVLNGQPPYGTVQTITDGPIPIVTGIVIDGNTFDLNGVSPDHFIATTVNGEFRAAGPSAGVLVRNQNISFANIGTPDDGSLVYSPDAKPTGGFGTACSGGSNQGAFVQRRNGSWICP